MEQLKRIAIILPAKLPVPAVLGGAIEGTINLLIDENEIQKKVHFTIFSRANKLAKVKSKNYLYTDFFWIPNGFLYSFFNLFFRGLKKVINKNIDHLDCQLIKWKIKKNNFDKIVIYGNTTYLEGINKIKQPDCLILYIEYKMFSVKSTKIVSLGKKVSKIITCSDFIKTNIVLNACVESTKVKVIRNPIDLIKFQQIFSENDKIFLRKELQIDRDEIVLLFVGRIVPKKGIKELLFATKNITKKHKVKLVVVGSFGSNFGAKVSDDSYSIELAPIINSLGNKVIFTGYIPNPELPKYFSLADIFIMPTLYEEAAGKVLIEAMASGLPVVVSNKGGIPEYVTNDTAIMVDVDNKFVNKLEDSIILLVENKELRKKMGEQGRILAKEFSPSEYYKKYINTVLN